VQDARDQADRLYDAQARKKARKQTLGEPTAGAANARAPKPRSAPASAQMSRLTNRLRARVFE